MRRFDVAVRIDLEDLEAAADIAQVDPAAVGRENEAGVAHLALEVGIEDHRRYDFGMLFLLLFGRQGHLLFDLAAEGVEDDELGRLAGDGQELPVGGQGQGLRPESGQVRLDAVWRHDLVDR